MSRMTIKGLFYTLIVFAIVVAVVYISVNYIYMKNTVAKSLHNESINKAYYATKKLTELNDKVARAYSDAKEDMYDSLKQAQKYLKDNGRKASLDELKKQIEKNRDGIYYHIYIINKDFVIENTTFAPDMGLDFHIVPDALKDLKKAYLDPAHIDLSSIKNDAVTNDYKRYILQRSLSGDFLVQLSLNLDKGNSVKDFSTNMSKSIPALLSSEIYSIYSDENIYDNIHLVWSQNYINMTKADRLLKRDVYDFFMSKFDPKNRLSKNNFKENIFEFVEKDQYKDFYFYKDNQYIHQVMMPFYSYLNTDEGSVEILSLEFDETQAKEIIRNMNIINIFIWITLAIFAYVVIRLINSRIIKPVAMLQLKMKNKDSVERDIILKNSDEISSMMHIYNQLLLDLNREIITNEELLEQFKDFTGNAIHQIRTPLSVIKIVLEMIETKNRDAILQIESSLISIEHMYDSLAYGLQKNEIEFIAQKLDFSKLLEERISIFSTVARAHDREIFSQIEPDIYVNINKTEAEYLIDNNISNAIKYGSLAKKIEISLCSIEDEAVLSILSAGEKIEDKEVIFERYHRGEKSRKGSGVGLHMVQSICKKSSILINIEYLDGYNRFNYYISKI